MDNNKVKYSSYLYEIDNSFLQIDSKMFRKLTIKFNKVYNPARNVQSMNFTDIILDYDEYSKQGAEKHIRETKHYYWNIKIEVKNGYKGI